MEIRQENGEMVIVLKPHELSLFRGKHASIIQRNIRIREEFWRIKTDYPEKKSSEIMIHLGEVFCPKHFGQYLSHSSIDSIVYPRTSRSKFIELDAKATLQELLQPE